MLNRVSEGDFPGLLFYREGLLLVQIPMLEQHFSFQPLGCTVPSPLAICYALGVLTQAGAKKISLVGFDGYQKGDSRQIEVLNLLEQYQESCSSVNLCSLTPTSYPLRMGSIYAPIV